PSCLSKRGEAAGTGEAAPVRECNNRVGHSPQFASSPIVSRPAWPRAAAPPGCRGYRINLFQFENDRPVAKRERAAIVPGLAPGSSGCLRGAGRPNSPSPLLRDRAWERTCVMLRLALTRTVAFLRDESGPTAVEYAVMLALIIVVC